MEKQTVNISGEFTIDEFRDILSSLAFEGYSVTAIRSREGWTIEGAKERVQVSGQISVSPGIFPQNPGYFGS